MNDPLSTVAAIYEAFAKGDTPSLLDKLADDVQWEAWADNSAQKAGVPWLESRQGKEGALAFFSVIGEWKITDFQVLSLMAGGNQVTAEITITAEIPGGAQIRDEEVHLWTFDETGKVVRFRHYVDTAKHIAASRSSSA